MVEKNEQDLIQRQQEAQQQQIQLQQQQMQAEAQAKEADMQLKDQLNQRDNETKIIVATISAQSSMTDDGIQEPEFSEEAKAKLMENMRQFDQRLKLDRERLAFDKEKARTDAELKRKQINKSIRSTKK